ncbi:lipopolysaccharide heptosyltransferase I [Pseudomonas oryzihabitans]|uniref:lipopolysaccharide heptosyltransferase I n=1 Tax=Pseudomonas oryzihabitans TaxID=47885 RepID=UPI00111EC9E5|nr:lipopolysaccharide heptosyltransferase I [Pseudomonas psychrotolerans]QDD91376.1 lipopolysaccharide heptosyltransferase I [Pseudomonas psychrotolerans]
MRVLLIKTSSLGDVIHTLPALTDAARAIPGICFDWVVEEGFAEIPAWHPAVGQVIPVALRRWRKQPFSAWASGEWGEFKNRVREQAYDRVIDAQGLLKSAWLTRYVNAPVAGLDRHSAREPLASRFYDERYHVAKGQHALERVRQLFAQALDYPLPNSVGDYGLDRHRLAGPNETPYVVFLHGTTWVSKHWPEAHWRELAERMSRLDWPVRLLWGNEAEHARAERIADGLDGVQVLPRLNLAGVAKVLAGARACVAVDTGLGHLAAALDVPTVSLYGPTSPKKVGAYGRSQVHLSAVGLDGTDEPRDQPAASLAALTPERVELELETLLLEDLPA